MPDGSGSIKQGRKFDQVLQGAREVFLRDGFEGASVDNIARAAGVSKATLYSYFPDKRHLFMEIAKRQCAIQAENTMSALDLDAPIGDILATVAFEMVSFICSEFGQRIFRICVAEADRFPQLGQEFYESGPRLVRARMIELLQLGISRKELVVDDINLAADQFPELCKADLFPRMVFMGEHTFSEDARRRVAQGAVATFMARFGCTDASRSI